MPRIASGKKFRRTPDLLRGRTDHVFPGNGQARDIDGCLFEATGRLRKALGVRELVDWTTNPFLTRQINAMTAFPIPKGPNELVFAYGGRVAFARRRGVTQILADRYDPPESSLGEYFAQRAGWLFISNGKDGNRKWNGAYDAPVGVTEAPLPPNAKTIIGAANGLGDAWSLSGATNYTFQYRAAFVNATGHEGPPSGAGDSSDLTGVVNRAIIMISGLAPPEQDDLIYRNIYKRAQDGGYYLWRQVAADERVVYDHEVPLATASAGSPLVESLQAPPTSRFIAFHRGRGYYAPEESHFVYYSDSGFPEQMSSGLQFIEIGSANEPISGMVAFADSLVVFKPTSMWQITTLADGTPVPTALHMSIGSIAPRASVPVYDTLVFVGQDGVYSFDGGSIQPLTDEQNDDWRLVSPALLRNAVAWADESERRLFVAVPGGANNLLDTVLCYSYAHRRWSQVEGFRITAAARYKNMPLLGVVGVTNAIADVVIWGMSHDATITGYTAQGAPGGTSVAGAIRGRVRFGPWSSSETDGAWNHHEEMEVLGVDVFLVYSGSHDLTMRWFEDRSPVATGSTTFGMNESGILAVIAGNQDLVHTLGWGEKDWGQGIWSGEHELFLRVKFPDSVVCREIEIEFENSTDNQPYALAAIVLPLLEKGAERDA